VISWRWGLSDAQVELLGEFRKGSGRDLTIGSSNFLEFVEPDTTLGEQHVIEFLWGYAPLYHKNQQEPFDELRHEIGDLIRFTAERLDWESPQACLAVCDDDETFQGRWRALYVNPLTLWLEELRSMLELRGLPSTIPRVDPDDPFGSSLNTRIHPWSPPFAIPEAALVIEPISVIREEAEVSHAIGYMSSLIGIIGGGTRLTATGNINLANGKRFSEAIGCGHLFDERFGDRVFKTKSSSEIEPVELVFRWARAAGLVRIERNRLLLTKRGRRFGDDLFEDWWALFRAALLKLQWAKNRYSKDRKPFWADLVNDCTPAYLRVAVDAGSRGVAVLPLAQSTWGLVEERWVTDDIPDEEVRWQQSSISSMIRRGFFLPLELLGCAETWTGAAHHAVRMTPLGMWAVSRSAEQAMESSAAEDGTDAAEVVNLSEWKVRRT